MLVWGKEGLEGTVDVSELMGTNAHLHMTIQNKDAIVIVPIIGGYNDYVGKTVKLEFTGNNIHVFSLENDKNLEFINENVYSEVEE